MTTIYLKHIVDETLEVNEDVTERNQYGLTW